MKLIKSLFILLFFMAQGFEDAAAQNTPIDAETRARVEALIDGVKGNLKRAPSLLEGINRDVASQVPQLNRHGDDKSQARVLVFLTLAMPDAALKAWLRQAHRAGASALVRGFYGGSLKPMTARLAALESKHGVQVSPMMFRRFDIGDAPYVVALSGAIAPCRDSACDEALPPFDRVGGNIGLEAALEIITHEGKAGRDAATLALARLRQERAR